MENGHDSLTAAPRVFEYGAIPASRAAPTHAEWESKKAIIRSLYITRDLPLKQVVSCMAKEHNFKAT